MTTNKTSKFDPYFKNSTQCLAKWHRTNLRLYNGRTYSCHHCVAHQIDRDEIKKDPSALTNTKYIQERRAEMLDGEKPDECSYCWEKEAIGEISDRKLKSDQLIDSMGVRPNESFSKLTAFPKILDVAFENTCNFACAYCGPQNSSKWADDIRRNGEYETSYRKTPLDQLEKITIPNRDQNPYVDAFWEWWDQGLAENLERLTITGGEPLLSKNTFQVLDRVIQNDYNLRININTNLCVPDKNWKRFIEMVEKLEGKKKIEVSVSLESTGNRAEYGRHGMEYDRFICNLDQISQFQHVFVNVVTANNALSFTDFDRFLDLIIDFKHRRLPFKFKMFSNEVRHPTYLDIRILPRKIRKNVVERTKQLAFGSEEFSERELLQINRTLEFAMSEIDNVEHHREDFAKFITQYDQRRQLNFDSVYPELKEFKDQYEIS